MFAIIKIRKKKIRAHSATCCRFFFKHLKHNCVKKLLQSKFFNNKNYILGIWIFLGLLNWKLDFFKDRYNNYKIFRQVFYHSIQKKHLYGAYPEYFDENHYGPAFALVVAPFAIFPDIIGSLMWGLFNALILFFALWKMPLNKNFRILTIILCTIEMANSMWSQQFNATEASFILFSYILVENKRDFWAGLFIALGTYVKLYAVIGLVFFLFSGNKKMFISGCVFWFTVFYFLPMLLSSFNFINENYYGWYVSLVEKNGQNRLLTSSTDDSLMGLARRLFQNPAIPNWPFMMVGASVFLIPFLRFNQYKFLSFRLMCLASSLMIIILLSTSSEHPTFIYPMIGVSIWFILLGNKRFLPINIALLLFVLIIGGLGPTDALGKPIRVWIIYHSIKAVPYTLIWILILKDSIFRNFGLADDQLLKSNYA